ncbi:hypothetical protein B9Z55_021821 [Caenorhabditis nigoni]|uniref:Uncharacterized protein n=1 Tax=Caenorhabditis nigoni TaxID=1611254 RepID=A0A2G5TU72_9PELO|nr:hypothetical protein B9Z55_021821 [Caenorhabditis nigoni]
MDPISTVTVAVQPRTTLSIVLTTASSTKEIVSDTRMNIPMEEERESQDMNRGTTLIAVMDSLEVKDIRPEASHLTQWSLKLITISP